MDDIEKIVIITRKTALEEVLERFITRDQAAFYLGRMGVDFSSYQDSHDTYRKALDRLRTGVPSGVACQLIERSFLPTITFGERDFVVTVGPDGLVVNTAKYLDGQPLLAVNPDPSRIDGVLTPFNVEQARTALRKSIWRGCKVRKLAMARAEFSDGSRLHALNDIFIGQRTHMSARYSLSYRGRREEQSSSGVIISTGAGSTGWFRSILTGASAIAEAFDASPSAAGMKDRCRFDWESRYLYFSVREPFISRTSRADTVFGKIEEGEALEIVSHMPQNGVVFSDGVESDYVEFSSGVKASIGLSDRALSLIVR